MARSPGWRAIASAMASAMVRPASWASFQAGVQTSPRKSSMAAGSSNSLR